MPRGIYERKSKQTSVATVNKGASNIGAAFQPNAGLQTSAVTTPEGAVTVAALNARFNSLQPVQAYQLSIAVRAAISSIANQISRCPIRLFDRKSGDEIIDGDLFNILRRPSPGWSQHQFVEECISWYNIENEIAIMIVLDQKGKPMGLLPICPTRLWVLEPSVINEIKQIEKWMYLWPSGMSPFAGIGQAQPTSAPIMGGSYNGYNSTTLDARQVIFYKGFNPSSHVRGCSPLITGVNELSTTYYAASYNKSLFVNGNFPNILVNVPETSSPQQIKDLEQRFQEEFSIFNGQGHKTLFIAGKKADVTTIGNGSKEGDFLGMQRFYMEQIFMLYRVPAIEAGFADKARYETADQERAIFLEQTILPQMNMFSEVLQHQFVNPYYTFSDRKTLKRGNGKKIGKLMEKSLDYSLDQRVESDIVVVLDPDQLPIMSEIRKTQWNSIQKMCDTLHVSVNEAAENLGFELPYSKVRDQIYIPSSYQKIAESPDGVPQEEKKADLVQIEQVEALDDTDELDSEDVDNSKEFRKKELLTKLHSVNRKLRSKYLESIEDSKLPTLKELDLLIEKDFGDNKIIKQVIRADCYKLRGILKSDPDNRIVKAKEYLNKKNAKSYEKSLIDRII